MMEKFLPEVCKIQYGYAFDSAKFSSNEGVPLIRIRDVVRGFSETYTTEKCDNEYIVQNGDLLIGMDGEFNIGCWKGGKAYLNQRVCRLVPNDEIDELYLFYYMPKALKKIEDKTPFVTVKHLSAKELNKIIVPTPPIEEQKRIAKTLDKVCDLIYYRKEQLSKLDELVKARFVEMFGDYRINDKEFDSKKGSELFKFSSGKFLPEEKRMENGVPVYGGNGVAWYTDEPLVEYPTVIIGRVGAQCGNIHSITIPAWITDNAIYIKEQKTTVYTLEFLTELMKMMDFYQYADFSGQPKITQKPLEILDYIIPPIELQNEFATFVKQIDKSKLSIQQSLEKLETLKKSLMQQYFG